MSENVAAKSRLCQGRYQNAQASCLPCIPGEFQNETGKTECKLCADGSASDEKNRTTSCECTNGTKAQGLGNTKCQVCDGGESGTGPGGKCEPCAEGRYRKGKDIENTDSCVACPTGCLSR